MGLNNGDKPIVEMIASQWGENSKEQVQEIPETSYNRKDIYEAAQVVGETFWWHSTYEGYEFWAYVSRRLRQMASDLEPYSNDVEILDDDFPKFMEIVKALSKFE